MGIGSMSKTLPKRLLGGALLTAVFGTGTWVLLDRVAGSLIRAATPGLEQQLSRPLGRPLRIGEYRGLHLRGILLGPTRVEQGPSDASTASIQSLSIGLDPLASLLNWKPVVVVGVRGGQLTLRRNSNGDYWVPGPSGDDPAPRLAVAVRLQDPLRVRIDPAELDLRVSGRTWLNLDQSRGKAAIQVTQPERGRMSLRLQGDWGDPSFALRTRLHSVQLDRFSRLLTSASPQALGGQLAGDVQLAWKDGQARCSGGLSLVGFTFQTSTLRQPLRSKQLRVSCRDDQLQIAPSVWTAGPYRADVRGALALNDSFDLRFNIRHDTLERQLAARLEGPWLQPQLKVDGRWTLPASATESPPLQLQIQVAGDLTTPDSPRAHLDQFRLTGGGVSAQAKGALFPDLMISSEELSLKPSAWDPASPVQAVLGSQAPVQGSLDLQGSLATPSLRLNLSQAANPILKNWSLRARWDGAKRRADLEYLRSPDLTLQAVMPVGDGRDTSATGDLQAELELRRFPLARLGPVVGTAMDGHLSAAGSLQGDLQALRPSLELQLETPRIGNLRLAEVWSGRLDSPDGTGPALRLQTTEGLIGGTLQVDWSETSWLPEEVRLRRQNGAFLMARGSGLYQWQSQATPLMGLQFMVPPRGRFESLYGLVSGSGTLALQPLSMTGSVTLDRPGVLGAQLRQARVEGRFSDRRYSLTGELLPPDSGQVLVDSGGQIGGRFETEFDALGVSARWLTRSLLSLSSLTADQADAPGRAQDLGTLMVETFGGALDGQLAALRSVRQDLAVRQQRLRDGKAFHPEDLRGQVDAQIHLSGDRLSDLHLDLQARGHLWVEGDDADHALQIEPFVATISGPLHQGDGQFSLRHLPFGLLALLAPVPQSLLGALGVSGRYRLGDDDPQLTTELVLEDARVGQHHLILEKGQITLSGDALLLDLALKDRSADQAVIVTGQVPLQPSGALDVRVLTRGDGLRFLTGFTNDRVVWTQGEGRLRLILSGTLVNPQANGFLVIEDGEFELERQRISDLETAVLFDFNRLEVQSLRARVGRDGHLEARGGLGLLKPSLEPTPLAVTLSDSRISLPIADVAVSSDLRIGGALVRPRLSGSLEISHGTIRPAPSLFARRTAADDGDATNQPLTPVDLNTLLEEQWDFQDPLVLLGPDVEADSSRSLKAAMPNLPALGFDDLRVRFGPKLNVSVPLLASFSTRGLLRLNGGLDPSLRLQGVIEMLSGRLSVFTTSFQLDRGAPNVAVFTPSLGLIPYVDVALISRVSDSVRLGTDNSTLSTDVFDTNGSGSLAAGGQLRLVKVMVEASAPADRLLDNLILRSSPPMPQPQILSLIGGNSLAGLSNSGGTAALAAVLGQSVLTPVLGTLTDVFSQRLQVALYPTYVSPQVEDTQARVSGQVPPQLALVTELGVDLGDRFNLSLIAAPNRNDIPPAGILTYQINSNLGISASMDNQGTWQSQFQVFVRF